MIIGSKKKLCDNKNKVLNILEYLKFEEDSFSKRSPR